MINDDKKGISHLIDKEQSSSDKILKPDFNQKSGREFLAYYLQSKFKQVLSYDAKSEHPLFIEVKEDFVQNFVKRLVKNPTKRVMIGITGESASGKSTICRTIKTVIDNLKMPVTVMSTDNYFNDISNLIKIHGSFDSLRDAGYDVDSPKSFQLDILYEDLKQLSLGNDIYSPKYLLNGTGISVPHASLVKTNKVNIVEGMASMYGENKDIFDIKVYVETDLDTRKERFIKRACTERNQNVENAQKHWDYIMVAGKKYVQPYRSDADIILNGDSDLAYFAQMLEYIHTITNNFEV